LRAGGTAAFLLGDGMAPGPGPHLAGILWFSALFGLLILCFAARIVSDGRRDPRIVAG
jgi:hypothetical protein